MLSEPTKGLIGPNELDLMRPSSYLIHTSRAQIVDQAALIKALQNNLIAGSDVDVFEIEPLLEYDIFRTLPTVDTFNNSICL